MIPITQKQISFLSTIDKKFEIDKSEKYQFLRLNSWELEIITLFISGIKDNNVFLIFPFITTTRKPGDPYLRLSEPFLVNNESKSELISEYLDYQWDNCDFKIVDNSPSFFYIKYKKVYINNIIY